MTDNALGLVLLTLITVGVGALYAVGFLILLELRSQSYDLTKIRQFQVNPRTRISTTSVQSGPVSPEQEGARLGRASRARRVVVGGDPDSEQYDRLVIPGANDE